MTEPAISGPALVVRSPEDLGVEERTYPLPGPEEALVRPCYVGLCGTDLDIVHGDLDPAYVRYPLVLGHEWSGRVLAIGAKVEGLREGDPVVVEGILACGRCSRCRAGKTNLCQSYEELGFTVDGAAGPAVVAQAALIHRLAECVPLDAGALVEPAAVVLRGLLEMAIIPGVRVLVIGDGTLALLASHLVRMWSPSSVTMSGVRAAQRSMADAAGVSEFTLAVPQERAYDLVIEAAGSTVAVETALRSAARGGQVLLMGIAGHGKAADLYVDDLVNNDISVRGSFSYTAASWALTVRLLNGGSFQPSGLITHRYTIDQHVEALNVLASTGGGPRGKILFDMKAG
jgi:2-desacetyl-2-hydroxyethyl bacteriochlorophyllide A dehydrogenase